jgi:hypothetical protein
MDNLIQWSLNKIKDYASNQLNNASVALGRSNFGKTAVAAQRFIESPNPTTIVPQFQPFKQKGFLPSLGNTAVNLPGHLINTVFGKGIIDPSLDIAKMAGHTLRGDQLPQYARLKSPQVKLGYQSSNLIQKGKTAGYNPVTGFK